MPCAEVWKATRETRAARATNNIDTAQPQAVPATCGFAAFHQRVMAAWRLLEQDVSEPTTIGTVTGRRVSFSKFKEVDVSTVRERLAQVGSDVDKSAHVQAPKLSSVEPPTVRNWFAK